MNNPPLPLPELLNDKRGDIVGRALCDLGASAKEGDPSAIEALLQYADKGRLDFRRSDAVNKLAALVKEPDPRWANRFKKWLSDPALRYWTIPAYLRAAGPDGYRDLIKLAKDTKCGLAERAHAISALPSPANSLSIEGSIVTRENGKKRTFGSRNWPPGRRTAFPPAGLCRTRATRGIGPSAHLLRTNRGPPGANVGRRARQARRLGHAQELADASVAERSP
jgi:hypothetical protein